MNVNFKNPDTLQGMLIAAADYAAQARIDMMLGNKTGR